MREKIAEYLSCGLSNEERDLTWYDWLRDADQILALICEEIEKSLLTDKEKAIARHAGFIEFHTGDWWKQAIKRAKDGISLDTLKFEHDILVEQLMAKAVAQAQLQKILTLFRHIENPVGNAEL